MFRFSVYDAKPIKETPKKSPSLKRANARTHFTEEPHQGFRFSQSELKPLTAADFRTQAELEDYLDLTEGTKVRIGEGTAERLANMIFKIRNADGNIIEEYFKNLPAGDRYKALLGLIRDDDEPEQARADAMTYLVNEVGRLSTGLIRREVLEVLRDAGVFEELDIKEVADEDISDLTTESSDSKDVVDVPEEDVKYPESELSTEFSDDIKKDIENAMKIAEEDVSVEETPTKAYTEVKRRILEALDKALARNIDPKVVSKEAPEVIDKIIKSVSERMKLSEVATNIIKKDLNEKRNLLITDAIKYYIDKYRYPTNPEVSKFMRWMRSKNYKNPANAADTKKLIDAFLMQHEYAEEKIADANDFIDVVGPDVKLSKEELKTLYGFLKIWEQGGMKGGAFRRYDISYSHSNVKGRGKSLKEKINELVIKTIDASDENISYAPKSMAEFYPDIKSLFGLGQLIFDIYIQFYKYGKTDEIAKGEVLDVVKHMIDNKKTLVMSDPNNMQFQ